MNQKRYSSKPEELISERMLADVRLILSLTSAAVVLKLLSEVEINRGATAFSLTLLIVYSGIMRLLVQFRPETLRTAALVSSFLEIGLITHLIWATWNSYSSISPFYLWYVFYVVSLSIRYGSYYAIIGLGASIVFYTAVSMSPSNPTMFVPGFLGGTGFLFVLAFLFCHMSERQRSYQKQLLVANELAIHLASLPSSREMMEYLVEQTSELLDLERCWFVECRNQDEECTSVITHDIELDVSSLGRALGEWSPKKLLSSGRIAVSNKCLNVPADTVQKFGLKSLAAVPMLVRDEPLGVLYAANHLPRGFSRYDVQLLEMLANQAAPMIENSQLWEKLKDAAAGEERLRIARDLHDNFLQTLAAMKLHLEKCRLLVDKDPERAKTSIARINEIATQGLAEVRSYLSALRLMGPEPARLGRALSRCAEEIASRGAFRYHLEVDLPETGIDPQVSLAIFQITGELLNNAAKHSQAQNVWIQAQVRDDLAAVVVRDDGVGFQPPDDLKKLAAEGHLGLKGIEERVAALGGSMDIKSSEGSGTQIEVLLPLSIRTRQS